MVQRYSMAQGNSDHLDEVVYWLSLKMASCGHLHHAAVLPIEGQPSFQLRVSEPPGGRREGRGYHRAIWECISGIDSCPFCWLQSVAPAATLNGTRGSFACMQMRVYLRFDGCMHVARGVGSGFGGFNHYPVLEKRAIGQRQPLPHPAPSPPSHPPPGRCQP